MLAPHARMATPPNSTLCGRCGPSGMDRRQETDSKTTTRECHWSTGPYSDRVIIMYLVKHPHTKRSLSPPPRKPSVCGAVDRMDRWERRRHGCACRPRSLGSSRRPSFWVRPPIGPLDLHPCTLWTVPAWRARCGTCIPPWSLVGLFPHRIASLGLASFVSRLLLPGGHGDDKHGGQGGEPCFKTSRSGGLWSSRP